MLLKRLEIHGFKSFATRTVFEFDTGLTAIVGPNGSGKSNIADAVRWVLGEQSSRAIRTKKTEDLIFAGSANRPALGMAEVSLTLDNADSRLTVDYGEVTITRRIYRSGESEYLLNRVRVRLRDIVDLLLKANVGQNAYTVIGQGLVDAALSLRPEERRTLFEEAAAVKRHQRNMAEALEKLNATQQNLIRLSDIMQEIEPRLRLLERQAKHVRSREAIARELRLVSQLWYGDCWLRAQRSLAMHREALQASETLAQEQNDTLADVTAALAKLHTDRERAAVAVQEIEQRCQALVGEAERLREKAEANEEHQRFMLEQVQQDKKEIESLRDAHDAERKASEEVQQRIQDLSQEAVTQASVIEDRRGLLAEADTKIAHLQQAVDRLREDVFAKAQEIAARRRQIAQLEERESELRAERKAQVQQKEHLHAELAKLQSELQQQSRMLDAVKARRNESETQLKDLGDRRRQSERAVDELKEQIVGLTYQRQQLATHAEALIRLQNNFSGIYDGVRAILQAAAGSDRHGTLAGPKRGGDSSLLPDERTIRFGSHYSAPPGPERSSPRQPAAPRNEDAKDELRGIVGIVATLIRVPRELEGAIEVALGSHLQDIVVEDWAAAEEAIAYLKRTKRGRATFLPLDTVRGTPSAVAPRAPGVLDIGSRLVECEPRFQNVVDQLLARTVVVRDLDTAREILRGSGTFSQIVTLGGEIVRPGGSVTGGSARSSQGSSVLSRARELREVRAQQTATEERISRLSRKLSAAQQQVDHYINAEKPLLESIERLREECREIEDGQVKRERLIQSLDQERRWIENLDSRAQREFAVLDGKRAVLNDEIATLQQAKELSQSRLAGLQSQLEALSRTRAEIGESLAEARARLAVIDRAKSEQAKLLDRHEAALQRLEGQLEARRSRLQHSDEELSALAASLSATRRDLARVESQLEKARLTIAPARKIESQLAAEDLRLRAQETALRDSLLATERRRAHDEVELQRTEDEIQRLEERMEDEGVTLPTLSNGWAEMATRVFREDLRLLPPVETAAGQAKEGICLAVRTEASNALEQAPNDWPSHRPGKVEASAGLIPRVPVENEYGPSGAVFTNEEAEALRRRRDRLQSQLRSLGPVNPEAVQEYEELRQRHEFLASQVHDLRQAEVSLREAISSLEMLVKHQFDETFRAVAVEFRKYFAALFGGGSARLVREETDDGRQGGIEIVAQPPGKRIRSLSLLSGGERALTASALLLAILRTNPVPFCILDEVDAALDDVNVARFMRELRELAGQTQFIVITHNKVTIEAASTLYGISLGADHASQVVSLRLSS